MLTCLHLCLVTGFLANLHKPLAVHILVHRYLVTVTLGKNTPVGRVAATAMHSASQVDDATVG